MVTARNRDRSRFTPWGIQGGSAGRVSSFVRNPGTNREENLLNADVVTADPGDVFTITSAGAGGWGSSMQREPDRVAFDVRAGLVSEASAKRDYGVALRNGEVDVEATRRLRSTLGAEDTDSQAFGFGSARVEFERRWTRENYSELVGLLRTLPVDWRFFIKHRVFDALEDLASLTPEHVQERFRAIVAEYPELTTQ